MGIELDNVLTYTRTKQERDKGVHEGQVHMTSQRTIEGGVGIYNSGFPGILREIQLGITHSLPVIKEEESWMYK